jgi:hypothetical protein
MRRLNLCPMSRNLQVIGFPASFTNSRIKPYDLGNIAFLIRHKCGPMPMNKLDAISCPIFDICDNNGEFLKQRATVTVHRDVGDLVVII